MIYSIREGFEEFYEKEFSRMVKNYIRHVEEESLCTIEHDINFNKKNEEDMYTVNIPNAVIKKLKTNESISDFQIVMNDITGLGFMYPTPNVDNFVTLGMRAIHSTDFYTVTVWQREKCFSISFKKYKNIIENVILI